MEASGHGKIILLGEHAVVHGRPALAMAVGRGCVAEGQLDPSAQVDRLTLWPYGTSIELPDPAQPPADGDLHRDLLARTFATAFTDAPAARTRVSVRARLLVPGGAGLGSSAALSVAVGRVLDGLWDRPRSPAELLDASLRWERECHGNPSGVDSAMAVYGGVAEYVRGQPLRPLPLDRIPQLVVAHSGAAPSTRVMVEHVAEYHRRDPAVVEPIFDAIAALSRRGRDALLAHDDACLGELMVENQRLLTALGLSTERLQMLCDEAVAAGALGAKLTGGGGGGCMIALCGDVASAERVRTRLRAHDPGAFLVEGSL